MTIRGALSGGPAATFSLPFSSGIFYVIRNHTPVLGLVALADVEPHAVLGNTTGPLILAWGHQVVAETNN